MLFNSFEFIVVFLPATLVLYYLLGRAGKPWLPIGWLVVASLVFYAWWNPAYLLLIVGSMVFNYSLGRRLARPSKSRWMLTLGVAANLLLLGYYKYAGFFAANLNTLLGTTFDVGTIVLPLAISFFTFLQIAYLVDSYRGIAVESSFLSYTLFVTYFPHLVAGPLVHHLELLPQFARKHAYRFLMENVVVGLAIFAIGLFKKVGVADTIAVHATPVFSMADAGTGMSFWLAWQGALAYTFQLYFDFSGYADMAVGLSKMFGILLPINFDSPYRSVNIIDFWRRWHITLSRFLRDYLYFALGGNRRGKARRHANLFLTMLLGGLWHGASWNMIVWGAMHGSYLVINHAWQALRGERAPTRIGTASAMLVTFVAVVFGWVFFRAGTLGGALVLVQSMVGADGWTIAGVSKRAVLLIAVCSVACVALPNTQTIFAAYHPALGMKRKADAGELPTLRIDWRPSSSWSVSTAALICASFYFMATRGYAEFIYRFF